MAAIQNQKRVLVLCQRKTGTLPRNTKVETTVVPKIQGIVDEYVGSDANIEYLTSFEDRRDGTSDYNFNLDRTPENADARVFIEDHVGFIRLLY